MKSPFRLSFALLSALAFAALGTTTASAAEDTRAKVITNPNLSGQAPVRPYDATQQERMKWFTEARLGLFIHWGPYSVAGGQWPGRENKRRGEWIMLEDDVSAEEYSKLAATMNPTKFDAKAWVEVAKAAGLKYLVITAKHHDGFAMYHSKVSKYNIVDHTPFDRDPLKELAAACREAGIVFCVYYSVADWYHPEFPAQYSQQARDTATDRRLDVGFHGQPKRDADIGKYADFMRAQVSELLTNYGDIGIVWFDGGGALRVENRAELIKGDELVRTINRLQPKALINNRAGVMADYGTPEQRIPGGKTVEPFEVCMTINRKWGYNRFDREWKPASLIIRNIADIVSKGGNYLINVGPTGEGLIPAEDIQVLVEVGKWTKANAEAIYGAGPTPFGAELGTEDPTKKDNHGNSLWVPEEKWRCSTKPGKLFFTLLEWPKGDTFTLPKFPNQIVKAYMLADPQKTPLAVENGAVALPATAAAVMRPVLCVEVEGEVQHQGAGQQLDSKKDTAS